MFGDATNKRYSPKSRGYSPRSSDLDAAFSPVTTYPVDPNSNWAAQQAQARYAAQNQTIDSALNHHFARTANPLYTSSTWAVQPPAQTAGPPPNPFWPGHNSPMAPVHQNQHLASPQSPNVTFTPSNSQYKQNTFGRETTPSRVEFVRDANGRILGAKTSTPALRSTRYTQTEEYHNSPSQFSPVYNRTNAAHGHTAPLPQGAFGLEAQNSPRYPGQSTTPGYCATIASGSTSSANVGDVVGTETASTDDEQSVDSGSTAAEEQQSYSESTQPGEKGDVWAESPNHHGLRRALMDNEADWEEAYPGAVTVLAAVNPDSYQMPYGTKVINIKTEFPHNILRSIRLGKYSVMPNVAERIMKVWDARQDPSEKILFLFSVNSSKKFCGIADLVGPNKPDESIDGWQDQPGSVPSSGSFSVCWTYIKDVGYHQFGHIRQPHNDNPVGNMWNGMAFPLDTGRQVIEMFVKSSSSSSILGYPKNYWENTPHHARARDDKENNNPTRRGGGSARSTRGGRGGFRGGMHGSWRRKNEGSGRSNEGSSDNDSTPTADAAPAESPDDKAPSTSKSLPASVLSDQIRPGQLFSIEVKDGQLVLVTADDAARSGIAQPSDLNKTVAAADRAGAPATMAYGARSRNDLNRPGSSAYGPGNQAAPRQTLLHPAVSMTNAHGQHQGQVPARLGAQHYPVQAPQATGTYPTGFVASGVMRHPGEETPTHRPLSHRSSMSAEPKSHVLGTPSKVVQDSENALRAKYYSVSAEQYGILAGLETPGLSGTNMRLLTKKMGRVLAEKREIKGLLISMGVTNLENTSPPRSDGVGMVCTAPNSSGTGYDISPTRAGGQALFYSPSGQALFYSPPKVNSPPDPNSATFDRAPGGSDRQKKRVSEESDEMTVKRSISDLISSPDKKAATPRQAHENFKFFPERKVDFANVKASSFPVPSSAGQQHLSDIEKAFSFSVTSPPRSGSADSFITDDQTSYGGGVRLDA